MDQYPQYGSEDYYDEEMDEQQYAQVAGQYADSTSGGEALIAEGFEILEEELDSDYDPGADEIEEYAKYLGMDLNFDKNLFYIAKEGLKAPLPGPWKPCKSPGGQVYYYNFESKELQKDHPCDDYYRKYYVNEKSLLAKKKEEGIITKHIKKQQKQQREQEVYQMQMDMSGGATGNS